MPRSSLRHSREFRGVDAAGETPEMHGELGADGPTTASPGIQPSYSSMVFQHAVGAPTPLVRTLGLAATDANGDPLTWTLEEVPPADWLSVSPVTGSGVGEAVTVTVDPTGVAEGTYSVDLRITATGAPNSPLDIPVALNVFPAGTQMRILTENDEIIITEDGQVVLQEDGS